MRRSTSSSTAFTGGGINGGGLGESAGAASERRDLSVGTDVTLTDRARRRTRLIDEDSGSLRRVVRRDDPIVAAAASRRR